MKFSPPNRFVKISLAFITTAFLASCTESTTQTIQPLDSEAIIAEAIAIYEQRGFNKDAIANLVVYTDLFRALPEARAAELEKQYGLENSGNVMLYAEFEPDTGRQVAYLDLVPYARTATSCFSRGKPWQDCQLNYHPVDGCFLEGTPLRECKRVSAMMTRGQSTDNANGDSERCWNYAKGPSVNLPYQGTSTSQIKLAKKAPAATPTSTPVKAARVNTLNRPVCTSSFANGPNISELIRRKELAEKVAK